MRGRPAPAQRHRLPRGRRPSQAAAAGPLPAAPARHRPGARARRAGAHVDNVRRRRAARGSAAIAAPRCRADGRGAHRHRRPAGDFSPYELRLVDPPPATTAAGFDPRWPRSTFSFKAACPSDLDCRRRRPCPPEPAPEPRARLPRQGLRQLPPADARPAGDHPARLDRAQPGRPQVALVELLAYVADRLSYYQDAVATEAYLGTARRRVSVRRHARLLDYRLHERLQRPHSFLQFHGRRPASPCRPATAVQASGPDEARAVVFETLHPVAAARGPQRDRPSTPGATSSCCLPAGAHRATRWSTARAGTGRRRPPAARGDRRPGGRRRPRPAHRQVVRLTGGRRRHRSARRHRRGRGGLGPADALAFPLCVSVEGRVTGRGRGNVALADHGARRDGRPLPAEPPAPPGRWRPLVPEVPAGLHRPLRRRRCRRPASCATDPRPAAGRDRAATTATWSGSRCPTCSAPARPRRSFVVEVEDGGEARLRFGDDVGPGARRAARGFVARYRVGSGAGGNVGAEALDRSSSAVGGVTGGPQPAARHGRHRPGADRAGPPGRPAGVPAPGAGGDRGRLRGAWRSGSTEVQRAAARLRWTGSWYTAFVTVDRVGGGVPDDDDLGAAPARVPRHLPHGRDRRRGERAGAGADRARPRRLRRARLRRAPRSSGRSLDGAVGPASCPTAGAGSSIPTTSPSASRCT